jgi:hypothetical protein
MAKRFAPVNPTCPVPERAPSLGRMSAKDKEREERLAAALRENLRRRKAQARELDSKPGDPKRD